MKKFFKRFLLFVILPIVIFIAFMYGSTMYIRNWMPENFDYEDKTEHFNISYNESEKGAISDIKNHLENNYDRITTDLKQPMDKPVNIKIYPDLSSFHFAINLRSGKYWWINIFKEESSWVIGDTNPNNGIIRIVSPLNPGASGFTYDEILTATVHEFTHAVSLKISPDYMYNHIDPFRITLDEGLAVYESGQGSMYEKVDSFNSTVLNALPESIDMLSSLDQNRYMAGYSFVKYVIEKYGYDKIISLLKKDYSHKNYDDETRQTYNEWVEYLKANQN